MSTETTYVEVPFGENNADVATLLLAAAEKLELGPEVVRTTSEGFLVPEEVASEAGVEDLAELEDEAEEKAEPKKKSTSKKSEA